jgi:hypothetical protein
VRRGNPARIVETAVFGHRTAFLMKRVARA